MTSHSPRRATFALSVLALALAACQSSSGSSGSSSCGIGEEPGGGGCVCKTGYQRGSPGAPCVLVPAPSQVACPDPALTGTVRYVCACGTPAGGCQEGNDGAAGDTPQTAWRSYAKAQEAFSSLPAGGTIAFCRGGVFPVGDDDDRHWVDLHCRAGQRCVVRDYTPSWATADTARPILHVAQGNAFSLEDSGDPDHDEGYVFLNLDLQGGPSASTGFFTYNDVDDVLVCNVRIDGFDLGTNLEGSNPKGSGDGDGLNERFVLRNSQVSNNRGQGWLGGCNGCSIEYSRFDNNGAGGDNGNHSIYLGGEGAGEQVIGNVITRSVNTDGGCVGPPIVVHGEHQDLRIEGNSVTEEPGTAGGGCWGIAVDDGYNQAEGFRNVVIARNYVADVGNVSIGISGCDGCVIEDNVVVQTQGGNAIAAPDRTRGNDDLAMHAVVIRNNSILYTAGASGSAILLGGEGTGHEVVSNAIQLGGPSGTCFEAGLPASAYAQFDYNVCNPPAHGQWASGAGTISQWQAAKTASFDAHSKAQSPLFKQLTSPYDLSVQAGSPVLGAGDPVNSSPMSFTGAARGSPPDAGAYQK